MMVNLPCLMESCSNFLRPTCSYTECRLSFLTGSCPTERTPVSYSSCFLFDPYRPALSHGNLFEQWTRSSMHLSAGLVADAVSFVTPSLSGYFLEPCPNPVIPNPGKVPELLCCLLFMLPVSPSVPVFLCLTKVFSDHKSLPLSVSHILPGAVYRLSLSVTASFLTDYPALSCNKRAVP